jgi:hypothetical protein
MAPSPIDPASLTHESVPYILGVLASQMEQNTKDHNEIKEILKDHDECLQIFKFSRCKLIPWVGRNRWVVTLLFLGLSVWISSLDWLNRWLQWVFFPPRMGP